ncbi:MAG TPA: helix-turn-helix domain-containing protein [Thermoleophilaceae bacterium]|nr:helix-turn-helix domain-containing protein [Thermoleophilaceae bacterium]
MGTTGYVEYEPTGLEGWAECVWERRAGAFGDVARVIPDACMDLVWSTSAGLTAVGPNTTAFMAALPARASALGVRLQPGCAPPLFGVSAETLRDAALAAAELWGDEGKRVEERVAHAPGAHARRLVLLGWLAARARRARRPDPLARAAARRLGSAPETRVASLARDMGVAERRLRRRVVSQVGYGPKRLGRVLRLRLALAEIQAGSGLAEAAFGAGYVDQAHFTNDCRDLAGVPPTSVFSKTA